MNILVLAVFLSVVSVTSACSCFPSHMQYLFCSAKFVIHALPFDEHVPDEPNTSYRTYKLLIFAVYKDTSDNLQSYTINSAITAYHGATCGVHLTLYTPYILGGAFDENGQMELNLCQINQPYNNLRRCELAGITGHGGYHYKQAYDCSCKVRYCFATDCSASDNECVTSHDSGGHTDFHCMRGYGGKCRWRSCNSK